LLTYLMLAKNGHLRIEPREQVAQGPAPAQGEPDPAAVLGPVVQQVAPLAQRPDIAVPPAAVPGVVVEMRRRQHHPGRPHRLLLGRGRRGDRPAPAVAPGPPRLGRTEKHPDE